MAQVVATSFIVPLAIGMGLNSALGPTAERLAKWAGTAGFLVLGLAALAIVVVQRGTIFPLLGRSFIVVALFAVGSLAIGHVLGGPDALERTSLAIATVTRHPRLALLIATTNFPEAHDVLAAIVAFVIGTALATIPYNMWQKRSVALQRAGPLAVGG